MELRCDIHKFTSFCNYSVLPSLSKVYYYYYYYYININYIIIIIIINITLLLIKNYFIIIIINNEEKNFPAILRKSRKFIYGTVAFLDNFICIVIWLGLEAWVSFAFVPPVEVRIPGRTERPELIS